MTACGGNESKRHRLRPLCKERLMEIEWTERGITEWEGTMQQFRNEFPMRHLEFVDGKEVRYVCEGCNLPILEGDIVYLWMDNETCEKCGGPEQIKRIA